MAIPKKILLLNAIALTLYAQGYAPNLTISPSFFRNTSALFLLQYLIQFTWTVIIYPLYFSPLRHLPQPPGAGLITGHFPEIRAAATGNPHRRWLETVPNDGVIYYRWLFNAPRVVVTNPKALAEVLVQRSYEFIKPERVRSGLGRLLGVGILLAEGDEHRRQRRNLMPAFGFRHVKDLYPVFWEKSRQMVDAIAADISKAKNEGKKDADVVEIREWASRATLDIIGVAGMGRDFEALKNPENELYQTYRSVFSGGGRAVQILQFLGEIVPVWILRLLPLKRNEELQNAVRTIKSIARDLVKSKREKLEKGDRGARDVDILSVALESGGFSDEDLVNQSMTFLAAGHETTASALTWAAYLLSKHPDVQTRLREEVRAQLPSIGDKDALVGANQIDRLEYLNAVVNESMRVFPSVPLTLREAAHDTTIQGHFIPRGTTVVICPWATNVSSELWGEDAEEFNPARWLGAGKGGSGGAESNFAFGTFIHGPRSCIGKDFAKAEFMCLLAALVGRCEWELRDKDWVLEIQSGITARPKGGLWVRVREVGGW